MGPTRLQQPSTPIRDVLSEEDFNHLPEIKYTEPIVANQDGGDVENPSGRAVNDQICAESAGNNVTESPLCDIIDMNSNLCDEVDEFDTSLNSAAEKGNCDKNSLPAIRNTVNVNSLQHDAAATPLCTVTTTICTACSICIDDFVVGETLTLLPRYVQMLCIKYRNKEQLYLCA
jgi:hypothetical protein